MTLTPQSLGGGEQGVRTLYRRRSLSSRVTSEPPMPATTLTATGTALRTGELANRESAFFLPDPTAYWQGCAPPNDRIRIRTPGSWL